MSLQTEGEMLLANLKGLMPDDSSMYLSREEALKRLVDKYGQDFGFDSCRWRAWMVENTDEIIDFED